MSAAEVAPDADVADVDPHRAGRALRARGLLQIFNAAGVLDAADVHVAGRLGALVAERGDAALLACALAVRAPRLGHVCTDLATASSTVSTEAEAPVDLTALPWPEPRAWLEAVARSPLVAEAGAAVERPLRLAGTRLYLDRYWRQERAIARDLRGRRDAAPEVVREGVLRHGLDRLFPSDAAGGPDLQRRAAEAAHLDVADETRGRLLRAQASTLHRLLGWRPDNRSRFRHHRGNRLPHDVVVVDETSMVSLSLMARLVEAVRPGARLVLVGDPQQLASVEAGAVLGDLVGAGVGATATSATAAAGSAADAVEAPELGGEAGEAGGSPLGEAVVVLHRVHRYGGGIAQLAAAVQRGDEEAALEVLRAGGDGGDVRFVDADAAEGDALPALDPLRAAVVDVGRRVLAAAEAGEGREALAAVAALRVLCAHRRGPYGAQTWMRRVERWLAAAVPGYGAGGRWYLGRPLLVTENDYGLGLYNGDTGVVVADGRGGVTAVFERRGALLHVTPSRLASIDTVHAMTVHKSQGSQFAEVAVVLPDAASPLLTRELLHTAVTRAQQRLTVVGAQDSVRVAVRRPIARASGLRAALREAPGGP